MSRLQVSVFAVLLSLLLVGLSSSSAIRESASSRTKRQSADVKVAEYLAWIALGGRINPQGCTVAGCEVVDIEASSRTKRQAADVKVSELMAQIAMGNSCRLPACGLVDPTTRSLEWKEEKKLPVYFSLRRRKIQPLEGTDPESSRKELLIDHESNSSNCGYTARDNLVIPLGTPSCRNSSTS